MSSASVAVCALALIAIRFEERLVEVTRERSWARVSGGSMLRSALVSTGSLSAM